MIIGDNLSNQHYKYIAIPLVFLIGCGPLDDPPAEKEPGVYVSQVSHAIDELPDDGIVVSVDGQRLTRRDLLDIAKFQATLYARKMNLPERDPKVIEFQNRCEKEAIFEFVMQKLLSNAARERGISFTSEIERSCVTNLSSVFNIPEEDSGFDSLARMAKVSPKIVSSYIADNRLSELLQKSLIVSPEDIGGASVSNYISHIESISQECQASNKLQRAALEQALADLSGGMTFDEAAEKYSEVKDGGSVWGEFTPTELRMHEYSPDKLCKWAFSSPVGSITPEPLDIDDGLSIVKILSRTDGVVEESSVSIVPEASVELARITRRVFDPPHVPSYEEARVMLAESRTREVIENLNQSVFMRACIEYPNGTNFWNNITN